MEEEAFPVDPSMEEGSFATPTSLEQGQEMGEAGKPQPKKKKTNWAIWGTVIGIVGFIVLIIILAAVGAAANGENQNGDDNGGGGGGGGGDTHRCLGDGVCQAESCDPQAEEDCFSSKSECQAVCGDLDAWTCSSNACIPSLCDPEEEVNCYPSKSACKEQCQLLGYTCEGVEGQCAEVECDPDDPALVEGGCYRSESACINSEPECAFPDAGCNPQGTQRVDGDRCVCWDGVAGEKCDRCQDGFGPQFPCCFMKALPFSQSADNNVPGFVPHCFTRSYKSSFDRGVKNLYRSCATNEGKCWAAPTYNILASDKNAGGLKQRSRCGEWIDTRTGRAVTYADYETPEDYKKDFERYTADGTWIPGSIYCRTSADPSSWDTSNYEEFSDNCVASTQVTSCFINQQTGKPEVFTERQGTANKNFVHP